MAGLAAIDNVGFRHIDLHDRGIQFVGLSLKSGNLSGSEVDHVIGHVLIHRQLGRGDRLERVPKFGIQLGALILKIVVGLFQLCEVVFLLAAVGILDGGLFCLVFVEILLDALLRRVAGAGFDLVSERVHISAAIGENVLHRENLGAEVANLFLQFLRVRGGLLAGRIYRLFQFLVVGTALHFVLRGGGLRAGSLQESGIALFPLVLVSLPRPHAESFVP